MDSVRSHSADEIARMMKRTPLFMTDLNEGDGGGGGDEDNDENNIQLEALRALQYEGTRAEVALGFKERGNEMVAEKRWKDAKEFYTRGIVALKAGAKEERVEASATTSSSTSTKAEAGAASDQEVEKRREEEREREKEKEREVEEACYVNRALCNLELQNYRSTLHDTAHTLLHLSPHNTKALYRSALALLHLSHLSPSNPSPNYAAQALDACARGLTLTSPTLVSTNASYPPSPQHVAFLALRARILDAQREQDEKEGRRVEGAERKKREQLVLNAAVRARGIRVRVTGKEPELEDAAIKLLPDPLSPTSVLYFPVLILYPVHGRSDFIKQVAETERWGDVLGLVLGGGEEEGGSLEWDTEGEYRSVDGVDAFMETKAGGVVKVGRKVRVLDVLGRGTQEEGTKAEVEVVDMLVRLFVVPKGRVGKWVEEMRARKGKA